MSGEQRIVTELLAVFDEQCQAQATLNRSYAEDLLFNELLVRLSQRRSAQDIQHQVHYHLTYQQKNLDDDEFVVTRGC